MGPHAEILIYLHQPVVVGAQGRRDGKTARHKLLMLLLALEGLQSLETLNLPKARGPNDHINRRILQNMISGMPLIFGLGTSMSDPYVYVTSWSSKGSW